MERIHDPNGVPLCPAPFRERGLFFRGVPSAFRKERLTEDKKGKMCPARVLTGRSGSDLIGLVYLSVCRDLERKERPESDITFRRNAEVGCRRENGELRARLS
jgi:hypothetical protein